MKRLRRRQVVRHKPKPPAIKIPSESEEGVAVTPITQPILNLQQTRGNSYVTRMLSRPVQRGTEDGEGQDEDILGEASKYFKDLVSNFFSNLDFKQKYALPHPPAKVLSAYGELGTLREILLDFMTAKNSGKDEVLQGFPGMETAPSFEFSVFNMTEMANYANRLNQYSELHSQMDMFSAIYRAEAVGEVFRRWWQIRNQISGYTNTMLDVGGVKPTDVMHPAYFNPSNPYSQARSFTGIRTPRQVYQQLDQAIINQYESSTSYKNQLMGNLLSSPSGLVVMYENYIQSKTALEAINNGLIPELMTLLANNADSINIPKDDKSVFKQGLSATKTAYGMTQEMREGGMVGKTGKLHDDLIGMEHGLSDDYLNADINEDITFYQGDKPLSQTELGDLNRGKSPIVPFEDEDFVPSSMTSSEHQLRGFRDVDDVSTFRNVNGMDLSHVAGNLGAPDQPNNTRMEVTSLNGGPSREDVFNQAMAHEEILKAKNLAASALNATGTVYSWIDFVQSTREGKKFKVSKDMSASEMLDLANDAQGIASLLVNDTVQPLAQWTGTALGPQKGAGLLKFAKSLDGITKGIGNVGMVLGLVTATRDLVQAIDANSANKTLDASYALGTSALSTGLTIAGAGSLGIMGSAVTLPLYLMGKTVIQAKQMLNAIESAEIRDRFEPIPDLCEDIYDHFIAMQTLNDFIARGITSPSFLSKMSGQRSEAQKKLNRLVTYTQSKFGERYPVLLDAFEFASGSNLTDFSEHFAEMFKKSDTQLANDPKLSSFWEGMLDFITGVKFLRARYDDTSDLMLTNRLPKTVRAIQEYELNLCDLDHDHGGLEKEISGSRIKVSLKPTKPIQAETFTGFDQHAQYYINQHFSKYEGQKLSKLSEQVPVFAKIKLGYFKSITSEIDVNARDLDDLSLTYLLQEQWEIYNPSRKLQLEKSIQNAVIDLIEDTPVQTSNPDMVNLVQAIMGNMGK